MSYVSDISSKTLRTNFEASDGSSSAYGTREIDEAKLQREMFISTKRFH